jgi:hydroxymethylpyrimidine pyrophosphatase-like HAD family hydrolase
MYILNSNFNENEKKVLEKYADSKYFILSNINEECYILCENGEYYYNACFKHIDNEYFKNQKYEKATPCRMIKFYQYYLMETYEEPNIWYRGRKDENKNYEFDCFCDSLEEGLESV